MLMMPCHAVASPRAMHALSAVFKWQCGGRPWSPLFQTDHSLLPALPAPNSPCPPACRCVGSARARDGMAPLAACSGYIPACAWPGFLGELQSMHA